jgi:TrmH family RNA methyltransferase
VVKYPGDYPRSHPVDRGVTLALDGISDPGNFGTIIRTADWFGIDQIVCSHNSVDLLNPKVIQSTMGSFTRVNIAYTNLLEWISQTNQVSYGAVTDGKSIYGFEKIPDNCIVLIGNESHGLHDDLVNEVDHRISIPSPGTKTESLNAAIATSIIISEFVRKIHWS